MQIKASEQSFFELDIFVSEHALKIVHNFPLRRFLFGGDFLRASFGSFCCLFHNLIELAFFGISFSGCDRISLSLSLGFLFYLLYFLD